MTSQGRVLVVDDEPSIRQAFAMILGEAGYAATAVADREAALRELASGDVDVAFLDILLDGDSGLDLLREIAARWPETQAVLITGAPSVESATEALRRGAFDYLVKPVRREALLRTAAVACRHKAARRSAERYRSNLEAIFRSVTDGVVTVDGDLRVLELNGAAERLCGLAREGVLDQVLDLPLLRCGGGCLEALRASVARGETVRLDRVDCRAGHRPEQVVSVTASPLLRADGRASGGAVMALRDETRLLTLEEALRQRQPSRLVGASPGIRRVRELIESVADLPTTVLITGESGTGKEVVADEIHAAGRRRHGPLVKVNCSALAEELLESELFGHVRGAFTGAVRDRVGRFQRAQGGTLFLDEIGDMTPRMQLRFLRVLETLEVERVGDARPIPVDVRVVAATHRDLREAVARGQFREDLYFRLEVFEIHLPPLRDRREDIPLLVGHFLTKLGTKLGKRITSVSAPAMEALVRHSWPGNVRELEHALEHAFVLARGDVIRPCDLPAALVGRPSVATAPAEEGAAAALREALARAGDNKAKAARLLGISRRTLYRRLAALRASGEPLPRGGLRTGGRAPG